MKLKRKKSSKTKPPSGVWIRGCSTVHGGYTFARPTDRFDETVVYFRNLSQLGAKRKQTIWFCLPIDRTNLID